MKGQELLKLYFDYLLANPFNQFLVGNGCVKRGSVQTI